MWNARYADAFVSYGEEPNDFLRAQIDHLPEGPVLCLAEGEGRNAVFIARRGHEVTAVDMSEVGLANAQKLAAKHDVTLMTQVADLNDFDPGESTWAAIISIWAHMPQEGRARLHRACVKALKPGGVMLLEAYTPRQLQRPGKGGPPVAHMMMTPETLREELAGLDFKRCEEVDRDVNEGQYHSGPSTTVQVIAIKPA